MSRLIDADKLKECFDDSFKNQMVKIIIDRQPTILQIENREEINGELHMEELNGKKR